MQLNDELVQYYVVNSDLNMSPGKIAAQVAHVATISAIDQSSEHDSWSVDKYWEWYNGEQKKIILNGKLAYLTKLKELGAYYIVDNGYTEVPPGSLTCIGLRVMPKEFALIQYPILKRLRLL